MTRPIMPDDGPPQTRPVVDAKQLWVGGIFTAIVAALVALLGVLVCRWLFNIPLLSPQSQGTYGDAHTTDVVLVAAAAALVATGLAHLLLVAAPRPMTFFDWIVGLVTLLLVLYPFSTSAPISQKIATAAGHPGDRVRYRVADQRRRRPGRPAAPGAAPGRLQPAGPRTTRVATRAATTRVAAWSQNQWGPSGGRSRGPGG